MRVLLLLMITVFSIASNVAQAREMVLPAAAANASAGNDATVSTDAQHARAILKARQDAVDAIRAGRPAPYFLVSPSVESMEPPK
jgi:hypothetical protein